MDLAFVESAGPYFVLAGVFVSGLLLLAGYMIDWRRAENVGPGPLHGRSQTPS